MTLSAEGTSCGGLEIHGLTTLRDVRENFPVPEHFAFGVPSEAEGRQLATDYLPLLLLNTLDTCEGTLVQRPSSRARADALESENEALVAAVAHERAQREAADQARDALVAQLERSSQQRRRNRSELVRLSAEPGRLRAQLSKLRTAVEELRTEAAGQLAEPLLKQIAGFSQQQRQQAEGQQQEGLAATRAELIALRTAHEEMTRVKDAQIVELEARQVQQQQAMAQLRSQIQRLQTLQQPPPAPSMPSRVFANYVRMSQLKRECDNLQKTGDDLQADASSVAKHVAFNASLSRLTAATNSMLASVYPSPPAATAPAAEGRSPNAPLPPASSWLDGSRSHGTLASMSSKLSRHKLPRASESTRPMDAAVRAARVLRK